jgi:AcrR family transcriptional regulator
MSEIIRRFGRPTLDVAAELKERILDETFKALCISGAERLSMDQLAALAGVTKRTIYRHFGNKAGLVNAVVDRELDFIYNSSLGEVDTEGQPLEALRLFLQELYSYILKREHVVFSNYLAFEAASNPEMHVKQQSWYGRIFDACDRLVQFSQGRGLLTAAPSGTLTLLLLDLLVGASQRRGFNLTDEMIFAGMSEDEFFRSRWMTFLTLAGTEPGRNVTAAGQRGSCKVSSE